MGRGREITHESNISTFIFQHGSHPTAEIKFSAQGRDSNGADETRRGALDSAVTPQFLEIT